MFSSSVIITGGKQRCDVNATDTMDPSPHHVQLWPHVRASAAFSKGASGLRALSPEACSQVSRWFDIVGEITYLVDLLGHMSSMT